MTEEYKFDNIIASDYNTLTVNKVIASGQNLKAGTVIGIVSADGKAKGFDSSASDGTENAYGVLAEDVDATAEDKTGAVYIRADINENKLIFVNSSDDADIVRDDLRKLGIYLLNSIKA